MEQPVSKANLNPHNEAPCRKRIGRVKAIFVRLTKIPKEVKKNQEMAFFGHFLIYTKESYFILKQNIQILLPLSFD